MVVLVLLVLIVGTAVWAGVHSVTRILQGPEGPQFLPEEIQTLPEWSGAGIVNFLVCGIDYDNENADGYATEDKIGQTDMILYVHYDTVNNKASILQIPRDTYVGTGANTGGTGKINNLYYSAAEDDMRMAALAQVIYDQFALPVDFYVTVDMDAVKEIIDIVSLAGDFMVYVPIEINDPRWGTSMQPGWHGFSGEEAEYLLRNRYSTTYNQQGDMKRLEIQQYFYSALYREFSSLSPSDLLPWMRVLLYRVNTDMGVLDLGGLAQKALALESADITFVRPSMGGSTYNDQSVMILQPQALADTLNEYFRPAGGEVPLADLNVQTLPLIDSMGIYETQVRSMGDIQASEAAPE